MSDIPYILVKDWQEARDVYPDQPWVLVWFYGAKDPYMRYHGEFYPIDIHSYPLGSRRWHIAGVWFNDDSITWMIHNGINYPFTAEDLVLYLLTWGLGRE